MTNFEPANIKWWNKPLVKYNGQIVPAELAVLKCVLRPREFGVWMNSRGLKTAVVGFRDKYPRTIREPIPEMVSNTLNRLYKLTKLKNGCPDLVIWKDNGESMRLVEVKCPHWDRPTPEQNKFLKTAEHIGIGVSIFEWQFAVHSK